ncbi:MAG: hypothetical protein RLZZ511_861 [Cyanobacteriota bacterium]|jgi:hypothetical protein
MNDKNLNDTSRTNWAVLEAMADEDIDYSDIPPLTDVFFERVILRILAKQAHQAGGGNYQTLMNEALRSYVLLNKLNQIYAEYSSELDPALQEMQYQSLSYEDW